MEKAPGQIIYHEKADPGNERNVDLIMQAVYRDLTNILKQVKVSIDSHIYGGVLGIDGGGRIPALVLGKTLNLIYTSRKQEPIETYFVSGARNLHAYDTSNTKEVDMRNFFKKEIYQNIKANNQKVLIVEDVVASGESLAMITEIMTEFGIQYEIATLSFDDSKVVDATYEKDVDRKQIENKLGSNIIHGEYGGVSELYGSKQMSGVHKSPDILFSKPIGQSFTDSKLQIKIPSVGVVEEDVQNREVLKRTRELVPKFSDKLFQMYIQKENI